MANILCIESATKCCSVALFSGEKCLSLQEELDDGYIHSERLAVLAEKAIEESGISRADIKAVAVSSGPGSYTGLRIGVSMAKGICFALGVPLISVPTLDYMGISALQINPELDIAIPMIDARRMEVYCTAIGRENGVLQETQAKIIEEDSFSEFKGKRIGVMGDGADKTMELLSGLGVELINLGASARFMGELAFKSYQNNSFEDVAYFEPFYLKDFVAGTPKKLI